MKLTEAEYELMSVLWEEGDITAADLCREFEERKEWDNHATHDILRRLIKKKIVKRKDPGFWCMAMLSPNEYERTKDEKTGLFAMERCMNMLKGKYSGLGRKKEFDEDDQKELLEFLDELYKNSTIDDPKPDEPKKQHFKRIKKFFSGFKKR